MNDKQLADIILELQEKIKVLSEKKIKYESQIEQLMEQIQYSSIEEAEKAIQEMSKKISSLEKDTEKKIQLFRNEYNI